MAVQKARLAGLYGCPQRKRMLQTGTLNFRPPVNCSNSAPRLGSIDEEQETEESDTELVCYEAAPDEAPSVSDGSTTEQSVDSSLEGSEGTEVLPESGDGLCPRCINCELCQRRQHSFEFDSASDESGYHEEKILRGLSEESYYSDGESVMLEEDHEDGSDRQMTAL